jgi:hypothetical protein
MAPAVPRSFSRRPPITGRDSCNNVASGNARLQPDSLLSLYRPPSPPSYACSCTCTCPCALPPASCPSLPTRPPIKLRRPLSPPAPLVVCPHLSRYALGPACKTMVSSTDELPAPLPLPLPIARYPRYPRYPPNETCRTRRAPTRLSWQRPLLHTHASATLSSLRDEPCPPGPATTATPPLGPVDVTSSGTRAAPTCTMPANTTVQTASACPGASAVTTHAFI